MNTNALWDSLQSTLGTHIPQPLGALTIFLLGWLIAVVVCAAVRKSLGFIGVNHRFGKLPGTGVDIGGAVAPAFGLSGREAAARLLDPWITRLRREKCP